MSAPAVESSAPAQAESLPKPAINWPAVLFLAGLWAWAITALAAYWSDFEQYSYGYFVPPLAAYFLWRRLQFYAPEHPAVRGVPGGPLAVVGCLIALAIFPLEYLQLAMPASRVVVWLILTVPVLYSFYLAWNLGGAKLMRVVAFPILFMYISAPWFSYVEKNLTLELMVYVTSAVTEILHLVGVEATARGTLITMRPGVVGVAEACSGIRSLQSGLMYALAVGELFMLTRPRRWGLVALTVLSGFILNIVRTFILAYQTDLHGLEIIDKIHDKVGVSISLVLPVVVWVLGKWLAGPEQEPPAGPETTGTWLRRQFASVPKMTGVFALAVIAYLPCHVWLYYQGNSGPKQVAPYFQPREKPDVGQNLQQPVPKDIWKELDPVSGGYIRHAATDLPMGRADGYYFFWPPRQDNFNILWHHPERCMTGAGWRPNGRSQQIEMTLNGTKVNWFAFPFKNERGQVLQIWGAWRNGVPVIGNRDLKSVAGLLKHLRLFSKGNSATEIVSFSIPYEGDKLPIGEANKIAARLFDYKRPADTDSVSK
jgi:exosortase